MMKKEQLKNYRKCKKHFSKSTTDEIESLEKETNASILENVLKLGRKPIEIKNPKTTAENYEKK